MSTIQKKIRMMPALTQQDREHLAAYREKRLAESRADSSPGKDLAISDIASPLPYHPPIPANRRAVTIEPLSNEKKKLRVAAYG